MIASYSAVKYSIKQMIIVPQIMMISFLTVYLGYACVMQSNISSTFRTY